MNTILVKDDSMSAKQFLAFARTLPYVEIVEDESVPKFNKSVLDTLDKSEKGEELIECQDANDLFIKLGI